MLDVLITWSGFLIFLTSRYNWEHYGNPDGPQAMQFGIGLPAWIVEEKNSYWVLGLYTLVFMVGLPTAVYYWWSNSIKFSGEQVSDLVYSRSFTYMTNVTNKLHFNRLFCQVIQINTFL